MKMDKPMATIERDGGLLFEPSGAVNCKRDFFTMDELVTSVSTLHPHNITNSLPPSFDIGPIDDIYGTSDTLQAFGASIKRAVLDRLGWLRWWKAAILYPESEIPGTLYDQVRHLTDKDYESRGYLVDIHQTWRQVNLAFWVHHQIPIYYLWGAEERLDERYSKLNPKLIAADTGTDGNKIVINYIPIDDGWLRAAASTWKYDDFMQRETPCPSKITYPTKATAVSSLSTSKDGDAGNCQWPLTQPSYTARYYFLGTRREGLLSIGGHLLVMEEEGWSEGSQRARNRGSADWARP
jgi:hypothetical protein